MSFQAQNRQYTIRTALGQDFVFDRSQYPDPIKKDGAVIYKNNKGVNQKFNIKKVTDDRYMIISPMDNAVLRVQNCKINNGAKVSFGPSNNNVNQLWELIKVADQVYQGKAFYFRSFCGKTLDVYHAKAVNDASIIQYDYHGTTNQIWILE